MTERWGDSKRDRDELDKHITRGQPEPIECPACEGNGERRWLSKSNDPQTEETTNCPECNGQGFVSDE